MNTTKKMIEQSIMFAIDELSQKIQNRQCDTEECFRISVTIKSLAEAYDIVHRGKRGE